MEAFKITLFLVILVCVSGEYNKKHDNRKWQLSSEAKAQLQRAINRFVDNLCFSEDVHPQLKKGICTRVASYPYKRSETYNEVHAYSRCSSCDAYVDPMCMLDCPQF